MGGLRSGGLAQRAGVNVETVRYYERRGLLTQPDQTGRRRYTEQSVRRLALIRRPKHPGFPLPEMGELLDAADGPTAEDILNAAHTKLKQVEAGLRELQALRCRLSHLVRACTAGQDGCVTLPAGGPTAKP